MKQFVQNLKVLRAISGRFLAVAVIAAAGFTVTTRAQADPGQGAVVTLIDRDATGGWWGVSPDGQLRLDVVLIGQGDFLRLNPDGTLTWQTVAPRTPMTVSVVGDDGAWVPRWVGSGSFHETALVVLEPNGSLSETGESTYIHVQGQLAMADGSEWSLLVVAVEQNQEFKVLTIDLHPM
jgi:hypothetical protein